MEDFANALRAVGEPIFGMDAANISMENYSLIFLR